MCPWLRIYARPWLSDGRRGRAICPSCASALAGRTYSAAGQAALALHTTAVLQVFQNKMLVSEEAAEQRVLLVPHGPTLAPGCPTAEIAEKIKHIQFRKSMCLGLPFGLSLATSTTESFWPSQRRFRHCTRPS